MDMFRKGMDAAQQMSPFFPGNPAFELWMQNYKQFTDKAMAETMERPMEPETFRRIYEAWLTTWSKNLDVYMRTPEFLEQSGRNMEAFSEFRKRMDEMLDEYWKSIRLPSTRDMDEIYQKLYLIDRKLDDMDRRFRDFERAQNPSTTKGKKP
jgi:hypothetical protein